jgi:hypothetical protein
MCPLYLDGEPSSVLHKNAGGAITQRIAVVATTIRISLAFVQFSSIIEDGRRVIPAPRSLRTEQCDGRCSKSPGAAEVRSTFQERRPAIMAGRRTLELGAV